MPTDDTAVTNPSRPSGQAPVQLNLTAAGWVVVVLMVASIFIASTSRVAVGFLIPLAAAVIIDLVLSWHIVNERSVAVTPAKTVVHRPDGIPLRIAADGPLRPIKVTLTFRGGAEQHFALEGEPVRVELQASHTGVANYVRSATVCTVFGLGLARQWKVHSLPMLHWAPAPQPDRLTTPAAVDEVARLRAYVPGDRMSRVSWPITARTGQMHVRAAGDGYEEFVIVVNLGPTEGSPGEGAIISSAEAPTSPMSEAVLEQTVELAATLVSQLVEDGHQVRLVTSELGEESHDALRHIALADPRVPPALPAGTTMEHGVVDRYVVDDDDLARRLARAAPSATMTWPYGTWIDVSRLGIRTLP